MESHLAPVERKRLSKNDELCPLLLKSDGTFLHKKTTWGVFEIVGNRIMLKPKEFNGLSLDSMESAARNAGRAFGLSWLFDPFELLVVGERLESENHGGLIYVEYVRGT
jgi:hypothetical protein